MLATYYSFSVPCDKEVREEKNTAFNLCISGKVFYVSHLIRRFQGSDTTFCIS